MQDAKTPTDLAAERLADHNVRLRSFLLRLLDPEDLGLAVTQEVRDEARKLVSMPRAVGTRTQVVKTG